MLGIIAAVPQELEALNAALSDRTWESVCGMTYSFGRLNGRELVTSMCGMGKVYAAICAQTMILRYAPEAIVNIGVAGALGEGLRIGDIVIGDTLVQHDYDLSPIGYEKGRIPGLDGVEMRADSRLCALARQAADAAGLRCAVGRIATGDSFISSKEDRERIVSQFGALACEMEGGSIAQTCLNAKLPFCVIRAVSDNADGSAGLSFGEFISSAAENAVTVLRRVAGGY